MQKVVFVNVVRLQSNIMITINFEGRIRPNLFFLSTEDLIEKRFVKLNLMSDGLMCCKYDIM